MTTFIFASGCCQRRSNARHGCRVVGQAKLGEPAAMRRRVRSRVALQLWEWFRAVPDFILPFYANYAATCSDARWCALVEHELSHCGVECDIYGAPKFNKSTGPAIVHPSGP
jgi:Putative phage metallopeptidase